MASSAECSSKGEANESLRKANGDSGLCEPDEFKTPSLSPPMAKKPSKAPSRKSMLNITRRQSKSMMGGIPFEDQVAAVAGDKDRGVEDRFKALMRISLSATLRGMQDMLQEEDADDAEADAAAQVSAHLRKTVDSDRIRAEVLDEAKSSLNDLGKKRKEGEARLNESLALPSKVRCLRRYTRELNEETEEWKRLMAERKESYLKAKKEKRSAQSGQRMLTETDVEEPLTSDPNLNCNEAAMRLTRLKEQQEELRMCAVVLERRRHAARERMSRTEAEMTNFARIVARRSQKVNEAETGILKNSDSGVELVDVAASV